MVFSFTRKVLLGTISLLIQSCAFYLPTTTVPTAFTERNDKSISVSVSPQVAGANIAYSPLKNFYLHSDGVISADASSYNFLAGLGAYFSLSPALQIEGNVGYGVGDFDWGDPSNGMSYPSQINIAEGNLDILNSMLSTSYKFNDKYKLSCALVHRRLFINYDRTNFDNGVNTSVNVNVVGAHLINRFRMSNNFNTIIDLGYEFTNASEYRYAHTPIILRIGLEFK